MDLKYTRDWFLEILSQNFGPGEIKKNQNENVLMLLHIRV